MESKLPKEIGNIFKKQNLDLNFIEYKKGYSYLMQKKYDKDIFNDLHIPAGTYIAKDFENIYLIKKIPIKFRSHYNDLNILNNAYNKYVPKFDIIYEDGDSFFVLSISRKGEILKELTDKEKQKVIKFFTVFYNHPNKEKISRNYFDIVNIPNYEIDKNIIINAINIKRKNKFDIIVTKYFQLIDKFIGKLPRDIRARYTLRPLQGDFRKKNLVWNEGEITQLIDYEMSCNGVLELEYLQLIKDLYGEKSKIFKKYTSKNQNNLKYLTIYLYQELLDLSVFKSAFCINAKYYLSMQKFLKKKIKINKNLIKNFINHY